MRVTLNDKYNCEIFFYYSGFELSEDESKVLLIIILKKLIMGTYADISKK